MQKWSTCHKTWVLDNRNSWIYLVHKHTRSLGWFDMRFSCTKELKTDYTGGNMKTAHAFFHLLVHWHFSVKNICRCGPFNSPDPTFCFNLQFSKDQLGTWWVHTLSEQEDNTQEEETERQQSVQVLMTLFKSLDGTGSMGLWEMAAPPPFPREWLLIRDSAHRAQWSAKSWTYDRLDLPDQSKASPLRTLCWAFRCIYSFSICVGPGNMMDWNCGTQPA